MINAGLNAGADKDSLPYSVSLALVPRAPVWMGNWLHAKPMYLGLDLRGGVHFLLQVDLKAALDKKTDQLVTTPARCCARSSCAPPSRATATAPR